MKAYGRRTLGHGSFHAFNGLAKAMAAVLLIVSPLLGEASTHGAITCQQIYTNAAPHSAESVLKRFASRYGVDLSQDFSPTEKNISLPGMVPPAYKRLFRSFRPSGVQKTSSGLQQNILFHSKDVVDRSTPEKTIQTPPVLSDSLTRNPELLGETWQLPDGESFHWMNVGSSLLLQDGPGEIFATAADHVAQQHPGQSVAIEVPVNPRWLQAREALMNRQTAASIKITHRYEKEKPYLDPEQLFGLRQYDIEEPNASDYFLLLNSTPTSPLTMNRSEFQSQIVASLRLARLEYLSAMDKSILLGGDSLSNNLPHASRVQGALSKTLQNFFWRLTKEKKLHITEITRVNRFGRVPKPAMRALFQKALMTARDPRKPTDIFILECDASPMGPEGSRRTLVDYYREEYGFEVLVRINPNESHGPPEYLMYLDTRSARYIQVMAKLQAETSEMKMQAAVTAPPLETWTSGWKMQEDFLANSHFTRIQKQGALLQSKIDDLKNRPLENVSVPGLDNQKIVSAEEAKDLLETFDIEYIESVAKNLKSIPNQRALADLRESVELHAGPDSAAIQTIAYGTGMSAKVLIQGQNASLLAKFLKESEIRRQVETELPTDREEKFDRVILSSLLTTQNSAQRSEILSQAFKHLKPGGELVIIDDLLDTNETLIANSPSASLRQSQNAILSLIEKDLPMTQSQLITAVAIQYNANRIRKATPLQPALMEISEAGFQTTSWAKNSDQLGRKSSYRFMKPAN